ncbi:MAG: DUF2085 domain-containing protein [Ktedonobacterales bacterium]
MAIQQANPAPSVAISGTPQTPQTPQAPLVTPPGEPIRRGDPPTWLLIALGVGYIVAFAALAFWPGATLIERLRALDGGICAQLPGHSFFPGGQQLPLCARNTGIYLGFASTFLVLLATRRIRSSQLPGLLVGVILGLAVLFMAVDGFNSLFLDLRLPHLYEPHNLLRLASGLGTGTAMAAFVVPVTNGLLWRMDDERSSFGSVRQLAVMLPVLALAFLAVASQAPWLLYPIALLSSAGLLMALASVNLVFILGITNTIWRFQRWRQLLPIFTLTVILAALELMALFLLKATVLHALAAQSLPTAPH